MSAMLLSPGTRCSRHAMLMATRACDGCGSPVCDRCVLPQPDGTTLCRCCTAAPPPPDLPTPPHSGAAASPRVVAGGFAPFASPYAQFKCTSHPTVEAAARCTGCGAHVCSVCDFRVDGRHACPACVMKEPGNVSPKRRNLAIVGCIIAAWSTVAIGLVVSGYFASMVEDPSKVASFELAVGFLIFLPSMIGYACSMSAIERNQPNSTFLWVAAVWNIILLAGYVAAVVVGTFS